ncbi:MAG: hypothetical protein RR495_05835 [Anaerovoracaceae bacterium]
MKKIIVLCLFLTITLSLASCGTNNVATPQPDNSGSGNASSNPIEGATSSEGTEAASTTSTIPAKAPAYKEYNYTYMGFSFILPKQLRNMITSGEVWTHHNVQWKTEGTDYYYVTKFFTLAQKGNFAKDDFTSQKEYDSWLATTKMFGSITVVKSEYLKNNKIKAITKCDNNEVIGKSSDGKYTFYFSTNEVKKVTKLFKNTKIKTKDPVEIPTNTCVFIYEGPHKK